MGLNGSKTWIITERVIDLNRVTGLDCIADSLLAHRHTLAVRLEEP